MTATLTLNKEISKYWSIIKDANDEIKLNLISLLSMSLAKHDNEILINTTEDPTSLFINKFSGAWNGDESPEEIINKIKENRSIKEPPSFD